MAEESIAAYAWTQSDKFVSLYIEYAKVFPEAANGGETVEVDFSAGEVGFEVRLVRGEQRRVLTIGNLCKNILPGKSKVKKKESKVVVMLRKEKTGEEWSDLKDEVDKKEAARKKRMQTSLKDASTAELLQDMYKHADDETRKSLREAYATGQQKRNSK
eukprot:g4429.t1